MRAGMEKNKDTGRVDLVIRPESHEEALALLYLFDCQEDHRIYAPVIVTEFDEHKDVPTKGEF